MYSHQSGSGLKALRVMTHKNLSFHASEFHITFALVLIAEVAHADVSSE